jgi:hypothetical protein
MAMPCNIFHEKYAAEQEDENDGWQINDGDEDQKTKTATTRKEKQTMAWHDDGFIDMFDTGDDDTDAGYSDS